MMISETISWLENEFEKKRNPENAFFMSAYMKNKFPFYGIKVPERNEIFKLLKTTFPLNQLKENRFEITFALFEREEREFHQIGLDLLLQFQKQTTPADLPSLERLLLTHSWWDSVDKIAPNLVAYVFKNFPESINQTIYSWRNHPSIWLNRTCIIFQLKYKTGVDVELLSDLIQQFRTSNEFFIQKAIGWMLREYGKTNPDWVKSITNTIELKPLSKREALRIIKSKTAF